MRVLHASVIVAYRNAFDCIHTANCIQSTLIEDDFFSHNYYFSKPVHVSPKNQKLHPREIIQQRCGLVCFDFDTKITNTQFTVELVIRKKYSM